jgi:hypothetical protein
MGSEEAKEVFEKILRERGQIRFLQASPKRLELCRLLEKEETVSDFTPSDWAVVAEQYRLDLAQRRGPYDPRHHWIILSSGSAARIEMTMHNGWVFGNLASDIPYFITYLVKADKWVDAAKVKKLRRKVEDTIRKDPLAAIRTVAWMGLV